LGRKIMIVAERKSIEEIEKMLAPFNKVLLAGCGTCVASCSAGGPNEVYGLAEELYSRNKNIVIEKTTVPRQCVAKHIDRLEPKASETDVILSMACGNGVQAVAERFPDAIVLPAVNTTFIGQEKLPDVWTENCAACGDCILWRTGGICPVARCAKSLLNGACGGASNGQCEVRGRPCAWQEIYRALKRLNMLHHLRQQPQVKNWQIHPGKVVTRQDQQTEVL
jgi:ferredoxin